MSKKPGTEHAPATRGFVLRWGARYDTMSRLGLLGRERRFRAMTADMAAVSPGETVLDVGCGTGDLTMVVKERAGSGGNVHGIDAAPEMVREAERKANERRSDVRCQVGLIENLPFPDDRFDVVISSLMLHHLPPDLKRKGIAEISRVLKAGGRFAAADIDPPFMRNLRTVAEAMVANGFTDIRRKRTMFSTLIFPIYFLTGTSRLR